MEDAIKGTTKAVKMVVQTIKNHLHSITHC